MGWNKQQWWCSVPGLQICMEIVAPARACTDMSLISELFCSSGAEHCQSTPSSCSSPTHSLFSLMVNSVGRNGRWAAAGLSSWAPEMHESSELINVSVGLNTTATHVLLFPVAEFSGREKERMSSTNMHLAQAPTQCLFACAQPCIKMATFYPFWLRLSNQDFFFY